jgi:FimV-like protein
VASAPELPASAPAAEPVAPVASAASAAIQPPSAPAPAASGPIAKDVPFWRRWLPHGLAAGLGLLVLGLVWRARSRGTNLGEAASTFFQDTIQLIGKSKPKVITVSQAGAEVARSVERLSSTARLVRATEEAQQAAPATADEQEATIKLEVARVQIEIGRKDAAIAMLRSVVREGSASQRQTAEQLLGQLGAA